MGDGSKLTSGDPAPSAGIYAIYNANGSLTGDSVRMKHADDDMPQTEQQGQYFKRVGL